MEESSSSHPSLENGQEKEGSEMTNDGNEIVNDETDISQKNDETEMDNRENVEEKVEEPKVGMIFNTTDEVLAYYKKYGLQIGFPVKKRSSSRDDEGELKYVTFSCARSGKSRSNKRKYLKPHPCIQTDCKALLRAGLCFDGTWRVNSIKLEHNHELNPDKARYFRRNKATSSNVKNKLEVNDKVGIKTNKNSSLLVVEAGGHESTSTLENDCRNDNEKACHLLLGEGNAIAILNYFLKMQSQNANFFYAIELDTEGLLRNVFWADARSRAAYEEFGDVITFDTTYLTNNYAMPFASFVGVNHHGQPILFGCGLISSDDTETFIWLFQSFLACMSGSAPRGIITDQNNALEKAIENVFPNARHRWCLWHIMKKLPGKLKDYNQYESIRLAVQSTVHESFTPTEFEERWNKLIENYELHSNDWLIGLYNERHRWVSSFVKDSFWAGMSPIKQIECMHAFFDEHVNSKTNLKQFVEQYANILRGKVEKENNEDVKCVSSRVNCVTHYDMEKQVQDVYTISKFEEFQNELTGKMYCDLASVKVDGASSEYEISEDIVTGETQKSLIFKVLFHEYDNEVKCSCCMYEFRGILCRHAIYVLIRHKIDFLPDKYIIQRWRKDVMRYYTRVKISYDDWNATPEAHRCDKMQKTFNEIKELANDSEDNCSIVVSLMHKLKGELRNRKGDCGNSQPTPKSLTSRSFGNNVNEIAEENQNVLSPNHSYGGGYGMGYITRPVFNEPHFQGQHQAWNGVHGIYSMPSSSLHGVGNQKPS